MTYFADVITNKFKYFEYHLIKMTFQKGNRLWKYRKKVGIIKKQCLNCKKEFKIWLYLKDKRNFCSRKCSALHNASSMSKRMKELYTLGKKQKYWLGKNRSEDTKSKIREKRKLQVITDETKEKLRITTTKRWDKQGRIKRDCIVCGKQVTYGFRYCRKHYITDEFKKKISESNKGKIGWNKGLTGIWTGSKNPKWKGGITPESNKRVGRKLWIEIRKKVYERDNLTCQHCGKTNCLLVAHHKIPYRISKNDDLSNLISLCSVCHTKEEWRLNSFELRNLQ